MFSQIFWFDFKCNMKRPSTWLFFAAFFIVPAIAIATEGGLLFNNPGELGHFNSAIGCALMLNDIMNNSLLGTLVLIAIMAPAIQKDFQYNSHSIYFTKPISKFGYFMGRFLSGFSTALVVVMGSVIAFVLMCNLPVYAPGRVASYGLWNYLQGFVYLLIPNTFFVGALFFTVVTYSRNMMAGYLGAVVLLILTQTSSQLISHVDNGLLVSLIDPYGNVALGELTKHWSVAEVNQRSIPFSDYLLYNRIFWMSISSLLFLINYARFNFQHSVSDFSLFRKKDRDGMERAAAFAGACLPVVHAVFDTTLSFKLLRSFAWMEYKKLVANRYFILILLMPTAFIYFTYENGGDFGKNLLPVTFRMVSVISVFSFLIGNIILVFYSGVLVWRERDAKIDELVSATPVKTWVLLFSKICSLSGMYITIILYCILWSICIQFGKGFSAIQLLVYFQKLLGYNLVDVVILICFNVSVQVLINNRYVGYLICIGVMLFLPMGFHELGIDNGLLLFNYSGPRMPYSDLNGFGHLFFTFILYKLYWLAFVCLLLVTSELMWSRGKEQGLKNRLVFARNSIKRSHLWTYLLSLCCLLILGSFIYYNTHVLNTFSSQAQSNAQAAGFEKKYRKYRKLPKLKIVALNLNVAIYPETHAACISGIYSIKNKGAKRVDSLFLTYPVKCRNFQVSVLNNSFTEICSDSINGVKLVRFAKPVCIGDSLFMKFSFWEIPKGFKEQAEMTASVVENGTFMISSDFLPGISYHEDEEIDDPALRSRFGLAPPGLHATDSASLDVNCISPDADWIEYECTLSTSCDQTALTSGDLLRKWEKNGRNYFQYKMNSPAMLLFIFQSGRYERKSINWKDVDIEVYYDKHHPYNIETILDAARKSLDYYTEKLGAYPFKQLRIVERPRYGNDGARGMAGMISLSEGRDMILAPEFGLGKNVGVFATLAHEIAHQWWGHQVTCANVPGNALIQESLAEYSSLNVLEKEFGKKVIHAYLKFELELYLHRNYGRETPLLYVEAWKNNLIYGKGAHVLYGIRDLIGDSLMNTVLKKYISKTAFQQAPYTTSLAFESLLKAAAPDSLKYAVVDGFEKMMHYKNWIKTARFEKLPSGKYKISLSIVASKWYDNGTGKMTETNMNDYLDVVLFGKGLTVKDPMEIYSARRKIHSGLNVFEIVVDTKPYQASLDPYSKFIDDNSDDNVMAVAEMKSLKQF
jgi:ABC-2 type transport system permease protein